MPRLSIDISPDEHRRLKAIAALRGQSLKEYVLRCTFDDGPKSGASTDTDEAIVALNDFLCPRIEQARRGEVSARSLTEIRDSARKNSGR